MVLAPLFGHNIFTSLSVSPISPLILQTRSQSSNKFRALKFGTSSSSQTIGIDSDIPQKSEINSKTPKKKRKLRPSFDEQIRDRWSLKNQSQRLKFPWQEQEQQEEEEDIEKVAAATAEVENQQLYRTINSSGETGDAILLENPVGFDLGNRVPSAPWVQRSNPREIRFEDEYESSKSSSFEGEEVCDMGEKVKESKLVVKSKDNYEGKLKNDGFLGSVAKIGASSMELAEEEMMKDFIGTCSDEDQYRSDEDATVGSGDYKGSARLPWERRGVEFVNKDKWRRSNTALAEKLVPESDLRRLRNVALRMKERIKVGAAGITQDLVDYIHEKWKLEEVVKFKFEGPPALNMKRTHDVLESRTGGLVIWRSGSSIVLFRGMSYKLPCVQSYTKQIQTNSSTSTPLEVGCNVAVGDLGGNTNASLTPSMKSLKDLPEEELMEVEKLNDLLDELGPRFRDWSGRDPQPVDADLLPSIVPGYKPPFRLLPFGIRPTVSNKPMTSFRRLARTMPPHFALGRNRDLQGLALAMVKLWGKSSIAKIAIKRGVQNTLNERMAEEIKRLTGGTLVSRNKDYIVFYRGNDFLSPGVTEALRERQKLADLQQDEEEKARQRSSTFLISNSKSSKGPLVAGTLAETMAADSRWANPPSSEEMEKMKRDLVLSKHASLVKYLGQKLNQAQAKVSKAEKALRKVQEFLKPAALPTDLETITDEERFLFRKIGLSMKPYLLLGRRGVFDGTVENMHLHWKYRELVKIIVKGKSFPQVKQIAISLEAESGGLLISLDRTTKGYVIIVYRGKNYQSPKTFRPKNLLTRRQALARSIELQRREALNHHISGLYERIKILKSQLEQMEAAKDIGDYELHPKFNDAYSSDDEIEDEGEEAYLETYKNDDEKQDTDDEDDEETYL